MRYRRIYRSRIRARRYGIGLRRARAKRRYRVSRGGIRL